ncbi:MAG: Chemotaxis response regulator protein-glutamate methylesterase [Chromatiales bacterium USCg_Taylor]|nr:MAG: Chemotaxis response regulator protein-glutamate methylesterase [Chromatiales bacterium USCg_Taylor]
MSKIRVVVVDDSAVVRKVLTAILNSDTGIEVVGVASDPYLARDKIKKLNPDVITLDVEMPRMDGVTFLRNLMRLRPMPVVMVSSLTKGGAEITLEAMEAGAVDFVTKPALDLTDPLANYGEDLIEKVKTAASARVRRYARDVALPEVAPKYSADAVLLRKPASRSFKTSEKIIAIGASTGGTQAIKEILAAMPADAPAIVVTQHIPAAFSGPFAQRMNRISAMTVLEAEDGQRIVPGHAYIAPGNHHLLVQRDGARYVCRLHDGPAVNRHRPSVDVLFRSVAQNVGANAVGVILTGMGMDGALGLKELRDSGAPTLAQDENTSVVWGMPGEAVKLGGVDHILPLQRIGAETLRLVKQL